MSDVNLPPYAQIAADLRDQIEKGTLAPGDRVPSTREITQRWGVGMATATKALTALRQEGIVRPIHRAGTGGGGAPPAPRRYPGGAARARRPPAAPGPSPAPRPARHSPGPGRGPPARHI